jgi:hypothetical protein
MAHDPVDKRRGTAFDSRALDVAFEELEPGERLGCPPTPDDQNVAIPGGHDESTRVTSASIAKGCSHGTTRDGGAIGCFVCLH